MKKLLPLVATLILSIETTGAVSHEEIAHGASSFFVNEVAVKTCKGVTDISPFACTLIGIGTTLGAGLMVGAIEREHFTSGLVADSIGVAASVTLLTLNF